MAPSVNAFLLAALTVAQVALGAPAAEAVPTNGTVSSIEQVANPAFIKNGPVALARAYKKFGIKVPDNVAAAAERAVNSTAFAAAKVRRGTGSATTTPEPYDLEYLTPVQIGTPAQTLNLDFDTGSSDLWVFSSSTPSSTGHSVYNPSKSTTSKRLTGQTWSISYGDGSSSSGTVYSDVVSIGGLAVTAQAVEAATKISDEFASETNLDGLLGLAFSSINTVTPTQQKVFWDNALSSLPTGVFTVDLKHSTPGKYNFGYIDSSAYTGSIGYTSVDSSQGFWTFSTTNYGVGSTITSRALSGIADTGTTLLLLPDAVVSAYYKKVSGSSYDSYNGGYVFPCSTTAPDFLFTVGGVKITIPGEYMSYEAVDSTGESCYGGMQSSADIGINIFGDIALKAAFVVFDGQNERIGWAAKNL